MPTHHHNQIHRIPFPKQKVLDLIHDPQRFVKTSTQVKEMIQDPADPQSWKITENLELILNSTTTFTAKMIPSRDGLENICSAYLGVKVISNLKVTDSDPRESQNLLKGEQTEQSSFIEERSSVWAPFYVYPLVKLQFTSTHKAFGEKLIEKLRKEDRENETSLKD